MPQLNPLPLADLNGLPVPVQSYLRSLDETARAAVTPGSDVEAVDTTALDAAGVAYVQADQQALIDRVTALTAGFNALLQSLAASPVIGAPS